MSDEIDAAQDAEEFFRQQAIDKARSAIVPEKYAPVVRGGCAMKMAG